jgi:hypothetical protein
MQYLLNTVQYPRLDKPKPPILLDAEDDSAILAKAAEIAQQIRDEGAEKVQVQVRRAVNLVLVGHAGDKT